MAAPYEREQYALSYLLVRAVEAVFLMLAKLSSLVPKPRAHGGRLADFKFRNGVRDRAGETRRCAARVLCPRDMAPWYYRNTSQQAPLTLHCKQPCRLANFGRQDRRDTSSWSVYEQSKDDRRLRGRLHNINRAAANTWRTIMSIIWRNRLVGRSVGRSKNPPRVVRGTEF